jgi:hypothetical protein
VGIFPNERLHLRNFLVAFEDVNLVDQEDYLFPPIPNVFQKSSFALRESAIRRGNKKDKVGARNEVRGNGLMLPDDGIGAGCIDDRYFRKKLNGKRKDGLTVTEYGSGVLP